MGYNTQQLEVSTDARLSAICKRLGKPAFEEKGVLIYCLDALEAMKMLPDEVIDLTVTSPPYNIGKEYEDVLPLNSYIEWTKGWIQQVYRLTTKFGAFWLNLGYISIPRRARAIPLPYLIWQNVPFYLIQEIVWNYGAGVTTKLSFAPRNEKFLWYVKCPDKYTFNLDDVRDPNVKYPNQKKKGKIRVNPIGKNPTDVWQIPKVTTGEGVNGRRASPERTNHPAQFPVAVIDRILKACSNRGELVFDPFIGSGTTAEVAIASERLVIGFEINQEYVNIASERISKYVKKKQIQDAQGKLL